MIACTCNGRLGNHLYQIATTINVAKAVGTDFVVPTYAYAGHRGNIPMELEGFSYNFKKEDVNLPNKYNEQVYGTYSPIPIVDNQELHGFFQNYKYFNNIRSELIDTYFRFTDEVVSKAFRYVIPPDSVGVCIRRGDYLMLQNNHCVLSHEYYHTAWEHIPEVEQIFIFSDDFSCKDMFEGQAVFVDEDKFVQLYLMTKMKHLVLANSTFSWWGAYMNDNKGTVVVPDPWFGPSKQDHDVSGLYLPEWIIHKHKVEQV